MPLRAISNGVSVYAHEVENRGEFYCPHCMSEMIFVDGVKCIKHFRHKVVCPYETEPETKQHLEMKQLLFEEFTKIGYVVELEKLFDNRIADVYIEVDGRKGVVECQCSPISMDEFDGRMRDYNNLGIYVMWVFGIGKFKREIIRLVEKKVKGMFYGRVYYYGEGVIFPCYYEYCGRKRIFRHINGSTILPFSLSLYKPDGVKFIDRKPWAPDSILRVDGGRILLFADSNK